VPRRLPRYAQLQPLLRRRGARSLLETIRVELHNRRKGDAVRLEIETAADEEIVERLRVNFELDEDQVLRGEGR